ncbi:MAG TPA: GIY-YIG nuclease family protein [Chloroflexota bacterium]|nr:GIY-YIG nuclease family protein [Chloroflexota bacterium]
MNCPVCQQVVGEYCTLSGQTIICSDCAGRCGLPIVTTREALQRREQSFLPDLLKTIAVVGGALLAAKALDNHIDPPTTFNYELVHQRKMVYTGVTVDPVARYQQHLASGKLFTQMRVLGQARKRTDALRMEAERLRTYRRNHRGQNPKYNLTLHG